MTESAMLRPDSGTKERDSGPALNALARERLAAGVDLFIECFGSDDSRSPLKGLRLRLRDADIDRLLELSAAGTSSLDDTIVDRGMLVGQWPSKRLIKWCTKVGPAAFYLDARTEGGNNLHSAVVSIDGLCAALNARDVLGAAAVPNDARFDVQWYGGVLVRQKNSSQLANFVADVLDLWCPEFSARERERAMARRIAESQAVDAVPSVAPARRSTRL
jgi:hypothetical protein